jgi:hypothetical protein
MFSVRSRGNVIFSYAVMVLGYCALGMAVISIATGFIHPPAATASVKPAVVRMGRARFPHKLVDRAVIFVDGHADFTSAFTWNTKQVYVALLVEYATEKYNRNEITVYDHIIEDRSAAQVNFTRAVEYYCDDIEANTLSGRTATLRVKYHVMSYSGYSPMYEISSAATPFTFPTTYMFEEPVRYR